MPLVPVIDDDRHAAGRAAGEQHVDHRARDVARRALRRLEVHAEARGGVHLDDSAARLAHRSPDVGRDEVDAADVEPDDHRRAPRDQRVLRVDLVGPVDGGATGRQVGGRSQIDGFARRRHGLGRAARPADELGDELVDPNLGHHLLVALAAAGVLVHRGHELGDGAGAVADDVRGHAFGDGDQPPVHHEDAVVVALEMLLDEHAAAVLRRLVERPAHLLVRRQPDAHAAAVVAVERLDHHRKAQPLRLARGVVGAAHDRAARHRHARVREKALGEVLVARGLDRDERRPARDARAQPLLMLAVAELDEARLVEADDGDAAPFGFVHQRLGSRPERRAADKPLERAQRSPQVERRVERRLVLIRVDPLEVPHAPEFGRQQAVDERERDAPGHQPHPLVAVGVHDVVDAGLALDRAGLAARDPVARHRLELERDVLGDVAHPRAVAQAPHEAARLPVAAAVPLEAGQHLEQPVGEARKPVRGPFLDRAEVELDAHHRRVAVEVRAAIDPGLDDAHGRGPRIGRGTKARFAHRTDPNSFVAGGTPRRPDAGDVPPVGQCSAPGRVPPEKQDLDLC